MKKVFKFTETRSWYFELDVDEGAQVEEALSALVGTEGFNYYLTDRAEDEYIGRRAGVKNSYCLGFIEGLENSYREQLEQDETMALAIVVPESVNRYMNDELNCKKMKPRPITVSSDSSIEDAGRQDGYGFGQGDRIASCA